METKQAAAATGQMLSQHQQQWPSNASGYKLLGPIGQGSFGLVWRAVCTDQSSPHRGQEVAIKIVDLEYFQDGNMDDVRREIQIMSSCRHKNVVTYYVSFLDDSDLWLVMPLLGAGSVADVLKLKFADGIKDEALIATILRQVIEGLHYFHEQGQIHRDIKAGNVLMDEKGQIFLSDFGVSAHVKGGDKRMTFVGSPCWMAPEVMEQESGYDHKADIWSLGVTALELARGDAPNSELRPMKVLMVVLHSAPPTLPANEDWSPEFRKFVEACLQKDPGQRPSALDLMTMPETQAFLFRAKDQQYIAKAFLDGLEPLENRVSANLQAQADEYFQKCQRRAQLGGGNGKQRSVAKKPQADGPGVGGGWDFQDSKGEDPRGAGEESKSGQQQKKDTV